MAPTSSLGSILLVLLASGACMAEPPFLKPRLDEKPPAVLFVKPDAHWVTDYRQFFGHLEPVMKADLRARVSGPITKVHARAGDQVQKDQVLVEIDPRPYEIGLLQAEAALARTEALLKRCEADERRGKQQLTSGTITQEAYDRHAGEVEIARSSVLMEKASRELAKMKLDQTKVRAPFAGKVMSKPKSPGNIAKADETDLLQIVATDEYYVVFDVIVNDTDDRAYHEEDFRPAAWDIKKGDKRVGLEMRLDELDDYKTYNYTAYFESFEPQLHVVKYESPRDVRRGRAKVKNRTGAMLPGMSVSLRRQVSEPYRVFLIAEKAYQHYMGGVWTINDKNQLVSRKVETSQPLSRDDRFSSCFCVCQGLTKGDWVAVPELTDGWSAANVAGLVPVTWSEFSNDPRLLGRKTIVMRAGDVVTPIFAAEELPEPRVAK